MPTENAEETVSTKQMQSGFFLVKQSRWVNNLGWETGDDQKRKHQNYAVFHKWNF